MFLNFKRLVSKQSLPTSALQKHNAQYDYKISLSVSIMLKVGLKVSATLRVICNVMHARLLLINTTNLTACEWNPHT